MLITYRLFSKQRAPWVKYTNHATYLLQVGHWQSGSMGCMSLAYCFCLTCRDPHGTKAEPNLWGGKERRRPETKPEINAGYVLITIKWPFKRVYEYEYVCVCVCVVQGAYCSAGREHTVKHIASQGNAHNKIYGITAEHKRKSSQFIQAHILFLRFPAYGPTYPTPMR